MEKTLSNRFFNLRLDDKNTINSKKINLKNLISKKERKRTLTKIERTKITTISS